MNKIIIVGNLCKDIELKYTNNNIAVIQNSVAVRNDFKNAEGGYDSEFINIVVWRQTAEYLKKYASKGSKVLVEGRLTNRSYDKQDGTKGYVTEVVAEKVEVLSIKKENQSNGNQISKVPKQEEQADPFASFGEEVVITDDMLPF